jgi:hypothetical protein
VIDVGRIDDKLVPQLRITSFHDANYVGQLGAAENSSGQANLGGQTRDEPPLLPGSGTQPTGINPSTGEQGR